MGLTNLWPSQFGLLRPQISHVAAIRYIIVLLQPNHPTKHFKQKKRPNIISFSYSQFSQMATTAMTTLPQFSGLRPQFSAAPVHNLVSTYHVFFTIHIDTKIEHLKCFSHFSFITFI